MKLRQNRIALAAITGMAATLFLLSHFSTAVGKGKPGGGGGDNTNFAFVFEDNDKGLFLTTIDDSNRVQLTRPQGRSPFGKAADINPRWSPDLDPETDGYQGMIAYQRIRSGDADGLYVINPDGTGNRRIAGANGDWTPNGKEIVWACRSCGALFAVDVATDDVRLLWEAPEGMSPRAVSISKFGTLTFSAGAIYGAFYSIDENGRIEFDASSITKLTDPDFFSDPKNPESDEDPSFSSDGMFLAYSRLTANGWQIRVQDLPTGDEMVLMEGLADGILGSRRVTWSPDSSQIATYARLNGSQTHDLIRITDWYDPAKRQFLLVTDRKGSEQLTPDWKPDWQTN